MSDIPRQLSMNDSCARIFINGLRQQGKRLFVTVDGVEQQRVTEYDCDIGRVIKQRVNADGSVSHNGGYINFVRVDGKVDVTVVPL